MTQYFPERLYAAGITELISVSPPGAQLTPTSKIDTSMLGKCPARRLPNGLWAGYDWRRSEASADDVRQWCLDGANVGLRAERHPGVDIDCTDPRIAQMVEDAALAILGPAPIRTGRAPKRLLMYRTSEPFSRMRLWIKSGAVSHLVEILGQGQQYVVHGIHPVTQRPYEWAGDPAEGLVEITRERADRFLTELAQQIEMLAYGVTEREGDGRPITRTAAADQSGLLAPSLEALRDAVAVIPNTNEFFPDRNSYLTMGYAIRASAGPEHEDEGCAVFAEWAARWQGNDRQDGNDTDVVLADWRRMRAPYAVGWSWLAEQARAFGYSDAQLDFDALEAPATSSDLPIAAPEGSDQWLADEIVRRQRGQLRFVPQTGKFLVWSDGRWMPDGDLLAHDLVKRELRAIADLVLRRGTTPAEKRAAERLAVAICSAGKVGAVASLVQSDRSIAISADALDHDPWVLSTPAGLVDLRSGEMRASDPDALCTKSSAVAPDFGGACPEWLRFLAEATEGDDALAAYLQRLCGYCLTGSTDEQHVTFVYGPGGNGKSVFLNVLTGILGDYAKVASMETFTARQGEAHSTDIAAMIGARLVSASETAAGKRWDEQRVKSLSGGEPVTARFMRMDNFTFTPQLKLVFIGNHKPESRDIDDAMRRRLQLVPFEVTPTRVDKELGRKLRQEWPAILAWMIEGCLAWQQQGLAPPPRVRAATEDYFQGEDAVGRWLRECVVREEGAREELQSLFNSWREWANAAGEHAGSMKRLSAALGTRGLDRQQDSTTRRMTYLGLRLDSSQDQLSHV